MDIDWIARAETLKLRVRNLIGGRWIEGAGDLLEKLSPRDGQLLYRFGAGDSREVEAGVATARGAFEDGRWSKLPVDRRKEVLHKLAALIDTHREELALMESLDVGKPIRDALGGDMPVAAAVIRFNAEAADKFYGQVFGADQSSLSYQLLRPVGVVAAIVGWNFPIVLAAAKIGPILATGNSLILKPSELTSLSALRLGELALEAGVPEGVFNVINGGPRMGEALSQHRDIDAISFTGSTQTGKKLMIAAGQSNMKRLVLECGGKAPSIVFDDSPDLEGMADAIVARAYWNQGQGVTRMKCLTDRAFNAVVKMRGGPSESACRSRLQTRQCCCGSKGHGGERLLEKPGRKGGQVRVEKMSESKPSDDASKDSAAVKTAGAWPPRDQSEGCSADRSDDSRCKGGMSSTQALLRNA